MWSRGVVLNLAATFFFWVSVWFNTTLFSLYMKDTGFQEGITGFVFGAGALAALAGRMLSGWAVDRWGGYFFLLAGALSWAVFSPLIAFTASFVLLLLIRLVQGFGLAMYTNASLGHVAYIVPAKNRGAAVSWWGLTNNIAVAVGPAVAGFVLDGEGFSVTFLIAGVMAAITFVICLFIPRNGSEHQQSQPEEKKIRLYLHAALLPGMIGGCMGLTGGAFVLFAPLRVEEIGIPNIGSYFTVYACAMIAARLIFGPVSDKKGRFWTIMPGLILSAASMALFGYISHPVWALVVPLLLGLGSGSAVPGLTAWSVDRAAPTERALASSTFYSIYEIGMFFGPVILGKQLEGGEFSRFSSLAVLLVFAAVVYAGSYLQELRKSRNRQLPDQEKKGVSAS